MGEWLWRQKVENEMRKLLALSCKAGFAAAYKMPALSSFEGSHSEIEAAVGSLMRRDCNPPDAAALLLVNILQLGATTALHRGDRSSVRAHVAVSARAVAIVKAKTAWYSADAQAAGLIHEQSEHLLSEVAP